MDLAFWLTKVKYLVRKQHQKKIWIILASIKPPYVWVKPPPETSESGTSTPHLPPPLNNYYYFSSLDSIENSIEITVTDTDEELQHSHETISIEPMAGHISKSVYIWNKIMLWKCYFEKNKIEGTPILKLAMV